MGATAIRVLTCSVLAMSCGREPSHEPMEMPRFVTVDIPASEVLAVPMSCDPSKWSNDEDKPQQLGSFTIDKTTIGCKQYRACVRAGACRKWRGNEGFCVENEEYPLDILWLSRGLAEDFCRWRGMKLPTALQWQRAVRGTAGAPHPPGESNVPERRGRLHCRERYPHPSGESCRYAGPEGVIYRAESAHEMLRTRRCRAGLLTYELYDSASPTLFLDQAVYTGTKDASGINYVFRCVRDGEGT